MQHERNRSSPEWFAATCSPGQAADRRGRVAGAGPRVRAHRGVAGDECGVALSLVDSFLYSGHSVMRLHGSPNRTGAELMGSLLDACTDAGADLLTDARVSHLFADAEGRISGLRCERPDGSTEDLGCGALILACCGFAGNQEMVAEYIPELRYAEFFGHPGNQGEAIQWGRELGAAIADIRSYQGHGGLAKGYGVPILWAGHPGRRHPGKPRRTALFRRIAGLFEQR